MALFHADSLSKRFGGRQVVSGVSLQVEPGETVGLLGANGAGKSTTFRMVVGLLKPDAGSIRLGDTVRLSVAPGKPRGFDAGWGANMRSQEAS